MRVNLIANVLGRVAALIAAVGFLPLYLKHLGAEAFGLVGFFTALVSVVALTDIGLSATLSRELARLSAESCVVLMRDTVRTFELVYLGLMLTLALFLYFAAPYIGSHWIQASQLSVESTIQSVRLMSVAATLQLASSLYQGGLIGLQRHVRLNVLQGTVALARGAVTLGVLRLVSATAEAFFITQATVSFFSLIWIRREVWVALGVPSQRAQFRQTILASAWRYGGGMVVMTLTGTMLMQSDKFVLSRLLPIGLFGLYSLYWTVAQLPGSMISTPVQNTLFPRLTQLVADRDYTGLSHLYHLGSQALALLVLPVSAVIAAFSNELLTLWLGPETPIYSSAYVLSLLVAGSALSALTVVPYAMQLAHGRTRLPVLINSVAVLVFVPGLTLLVQRFGVNGAGFAWLTLNAGYILLILLLMHRQILIGEGLRWFVHGVAIPSSVAFGSAYLFAAVTRLPKNPPLLVLYLFLCWLVTQILTSLVSPVGRRFIWSLVPNLR